MTMRLSSIPVVMDRCCKSHVRDLESFVSLTPTISSPLFSLKVICRSTNTQRSSLQLHMRTASQFRPFAMLLLYSPM